MDWHDCALHVSLQGVSITALPVLISLVTNPGFGFSFQAPGLFCLFACWHLLPGHNLLLVTQAAYLQM